MSTKIAEREIEREARRLLRKLANAKGRFVPARSGGFCLEVPGRAASDGAAIARELVMQFVLRGWLERAGGRTETYNLSDAGLGWLLRTQAAHGDPFALQHRIMETREIESEDGIRRNVQVNAGESPIGRLRQRGLITAVQFAAGERLRRDFTLAQLSPRLGVDLTAPIVMGRRSASGQALLSDTVIAAKQRFSRAMHAAGAGLADLLFDVCCHLKGLEEAETEKGWPQRAGKVVLAIALDRLADHYGMGVRGAPNARLRVWQMEAEEGP